MGRRHPDYSLREEVALMEEELERMKKEQLSWNIMRDPREYDRRQKIINNFFYFIAEYERKHSRHNRAPPGMHLDSLNNQFAMLNEIEEWGILKEKIEKLSKARLKTQLNRYWDECQQDGKQHSLADFKLKTLAQKWSNKGFK